MRHGFNPIPLEDYVRLDLKANPGETEREAIAGLQDSLRAFQRGELCNCGEPIWVIGSSVAGHACLTCITGSTDTSEDYEVAEACHNAKRLPG